MKRDGVKTCDVKYEQAIVLAPGFADAYYGRGVAYYAKGIHDRARRDLQKALELGLPVELQRAAENLLQEIGP